MRRFATSHPRLAALLQFGALALAVAALLLIRAGTAPAADAPAHISVTPTPAAAPLTSANCFGGVLAADPVHCRVLQGAHDQGVMTVEAMYEGGGALWIFVAEKGDAALGTIYSHIESAGHREYLDNPDICRAWRAAYGCWPGVLQTGRVVALPASEHHDDIKLRGGGSEARKQIRGWPSFKQVWPVAGGATGAQSAATRISVAGVDTTKFPDRDCTTYNPVVLTPKDCDAYVNFPGYNIAGWLEAYPHGTFVYARPPSEASKDSFVADVEAELRRRFAYQIEQGTNAFTVVPVKYDYDQLWRWAVVLQRFAQADGNTMGIYRAEPWYNFEYPGRNTAYPVPGLAAVSNQKDNPSETRPTILIHTLDLDATVAALPRLLPLLGVPIDAVGVVLELDLRPTPPEWPSA